MRRSRWGQAGGDLDASCSWDGDPPILTAALAQSLAKNHMQRVFLLFSQVLGGLADPASPLFSKHLLLLDTLHEVGGQGVNRFLDPLQERRLA